jgi:hypothetical protein
MTPLYVCLSVVIDTFDLDVPTHIIRMRTCTHAQSFSLTHYMHMKSDVCVHEALSIEKASSFFPFHAKGMRKERKGEMV